MEGRIESREGVLRDWGCDDVDTWWRDGDYEDTPEEEELSAAVKAATLHDLETPCAALREATAKAHAATQARQRSEQAFKAAKPQARQQKAELDNRTSQPPSTPSARLARKG